MRSEAQKRADKKYRESGKDKYRNVSTKVHIDKIEKLKRIALKSGLTVSRYLVRSAFYCANNNIDLSDYTEDLHAPDKPGDRE